MLTEMNRIHTAHKYTRPSHHIAGMRFIIYCACDHSIHQPLIHTHITTPVHTRAHIHTLNHTNTQARKHSTFKNYAKHRGKPVIYNTYTAIISSSVLSQNVMSAGASTHTNTSHSNAKKNTTHIQARKHVQMYQTQYDHTFFTPTQHNTKTLIRIHKTKVTRTLPHTHTHELK